jgi:adenylate cyclase
MHRLNISTKWIAVIFGLLITIIFIWLSASPPNFFQTLLNRLDYITYDLRLNFLLDKHPAPRNPIVIVDIDEKSLKEEGRWPWSRRKIAALLEKLYQQGVTVVAFDMLFSEPESNIASTLIDQLQRQHLATVDTVTAIKQLTPYLDNDAIFAKSISQEKDKVVLGMYFSGTNIPPVGELPQSVIDLAKINATDLALPSMRTYVGNVPQLQQAAQRAGALSIIPDADGTIRRYSLLQRYGDNLYPSLALAAVSVYLLENNLSLSINYIGKIKVIDAINMGQTHITTDGSGRVFIPYLGPAQSFPYYSAADVLHNRLPAHQLQNALVFVGTSAVGLGDMRSTPVESVYPGVEIHANVADALFYNHFPYIPAWAPGAQLTLIVFLGLILAVLFAYIGPFWIISVTFAAMSLLFGSSLVLLRNGDYVLPIILPMLQIFSLALFNITYGFFTESRRRYELKRVFEQYVPAGRVDEIVNHPDAVNTFEGERKTMSVLFMDIRGFTTISEKLNIIELKKLLNFFLTEMTAVIFKHGGTIDKYVGDMVMAFWGAPLPDHDHAKHAMMAGLDILATTNAIQNKLQSMNLPAVHVGVGVNTGIMDVGDMGSKFRRAYTVLGDAVNLASRLESLTKYYGVGMLVGEESYAGQGDFVFRLVDKVMVKGKHQGIAIYQPLSTRATLTTDQQQELIAYEKALNAYFAQDWIIAKSLFTDLQQKFPMMMLYNIFLSRIDSFMQQPPASDWDGVWEHHEK